MADLTKTKPKMVKGESQSAVFRENVYVGKDGKERVSYTTFIKISNDMDLMVSINPEISKDSKDPDKRIIWGRVIPFTKAL
jgi:hypothetical protein